MPAGTWSMPLISPSYEMVQQPPLYYGLVALLDPIGVTATALDYAPQNPYIVDCIGVKSTVLPPDPPAEVRAGFLIPRLVSLLGGILAVVGCFLWLSRALPRRDVAFGAALLLALTPMFLFESVAITNDILSVGWATMAVVLGMIACRRDRWWQWTLAGALAGLASLTKYSGLLVLAPLSVIWIWHIAENRSWRSATRPLWLATGFALVAGWWFVRNVRLYGEIIPMETMLPLLPGLTRTEPIALAAVPDLLSSTWRSFVGVYACGIAAPEWLLWGWTGLVVVGLLGLVRGMIGGLGRQRWLVVSTSGAWLVTSLISMTMWVSRLNYSAQGRLLFIAAPALYALVALGWDCLIDSTRAAWRLALIAWLLLGVIVTGVLMYRVYGPVETLVEVTPARPVEAVLQSGIRIVGLDLEDGATITTPGAIPATIYLSADRPLDDFYTLYVQVVLSDDTRLYAWEGVAFDGRLTTPEWRVGAIIPLELTLTVDQPVEGLAELVAGAYPYARPDLSEGLSVAKIRLLKPVEPLAVWDGGIALLSATPQIDAADAVLGVTVHWKALENITVDYTVSLQALDAKGALLAQCDQQPKRGDYPTSTWSAGRHITDRYAFQGPVYDWHQLVILLYDAEGNRLAVGGADHLLLASR